MTVCISPHPDHHVCLTLHSPYSQSKCLCHTHGSVFYSGSLIKPSARASPPRRFMSVTERQKYIYTIIYANESLLPCYKRDGRSVNQWNCQELTVFSGPPWHIFEAAARNRLFLLIFFFCWIDTPRIKRISQRGRCLSNIWAVEIA